MTTEAIEAIVRNSILGKWQTFDLIAEWCIEQWGTFISDEEMEIMWAKRERVM